MAYNNNVYLIDCDDIREYQAAFSNIDDKFINPIIIDVQNKYVEDILGSNLYKTMISDYRTGNGTASETRFDDLVDNYIFPVILNYTLYHLCVMISGRVTEKGMVKQNMEFSTPMSSTEIDYFRKYYFDNGQYYSKKLINYIINNTTTYPEYNTTTADDDVLPSTGTYGYFSVGDIDDNKWSDYHKRHFD